ncbi:MAG TPA: penicillin-binding protein 2 [Thermoleophilaceae bacterium]|nr:penicillin-binding protein 2 [Thermoleophilaceae bacterium]
MRVLNRRIGLLFGLFLFLLVCAVGRATWLTTVKASDLRSRAVSQQVEDIDVPATRGAIVDRHGVDLAVSEEAVTVFANPFLIKNPAKVAAKVAPLLGMQEADVLKKISDSQKGFVFLKRKLQGLAGQKIEKLKIEGIGTMMEPKRTYPQGSLGSQLIGTVGTDNYGLSGLEQLLDKRLHGADGRRRVVRDALGDPISIVDAKRAEPGQNVKLTLDATLQERVEAVLADVGQTYRPTGSTALVMDPRSGAILALANWPRVDANDISAAPPYARQNRTVAAAYEPGSTFKAITVAGALEEGLVTPDTPFSIPPQIQVADRTIKDAEEHGYETLTVSRILAQSSNIGAVKIGMRLGPTGFDKWVRGFGFGKDTGVDLPGESPGIVLHPKQYSGSSMGNLPIGQGIAVTPIQMAQAYTAIANGGIMHRPYVVQGDGKPGKRVLSKSTARQVAKMLEGVLGPGGTASEAAIPGYTLAGKTGTAQKPDPVNGGYSTYKYVASFIGFAPADRPRLLVAVMVDEPQGAIYGGVVAAPAFQKILSFALPYLKIPPR